MNIRQKTSATTGAAPKPQGCTNLKLRQITRSVTRHYDAEMADTGLKTTQYSLLSHVVKLGPIRAVELSSLMHMSASTLSRNLQPLVSGGLIELIAGGDARSRLIRATDAGQAKRAEAQRTWRKAQEGINAALGVERVRALHALIDDCLDLLSHLETDDAES